MLKQLDAEIRACQLCRLSRTRNHAVPGEGPANPKVIFIGEGPGRNEDLAGRPFVGRAGGILDELLNSVNLSRGLVYITNIVKCRPTTASTEDCSESKRAVAKDRRPLVDEIEACAPYLSRQLKLLKPRIVCALGDTASSTILKRYDMKPKPISRLHGRVFSVDSLRIIPMYHPAAALYTASLKDTMMSDIKVLSDLLSQRTLV